ncbi:TetR/AcrR family transcriptional regulator [Idiomarina tyrosinivorans]|uniref:TetR/AcrR family transcriptional regulator n=1 Tax=Idiomarina tyrosinivorans TaxID=1445662 RepID=A0A432ZQJ0_9GAMM|nr:TetR/AcrR family transcriptional regulator [Idiomarina tyrosinivorans]RUO80112.1 TetR/AcrR family transcriptional regulator [Idiomarina tyrosinivorans]
MVCQRKSSGRPSNREVILDAAERLVAERGAGHLTFDALVACTGISKGGLLYHFGSKDALLEAMIERMVDKKRELRDSALAQIGDEPNAALKSILLATLNAHSDSAALNSAMLATAANNPKLLAPLRQHVGEIFDELSQFGDGQLAKLLLFSVHGARLFEQLGLCEHCLDEREQFAERLKALVDEKFDGKR